jgi:hypothetical protein
MADALRIVIADDNLLVREGTRRVLTVLAHLRPVHEWS